MGDQQIPGTERRVFPGRKAAGQTGFPFVTGFHTKIFVAVDPAQFVKFPEGSGSGAFRRHGLPHRFLPDPVDQLPGVARPEQTGDQPDRTAAVADGQADVRSVSAPCLRQFDRPLTFAFIFRLQFRRDLRDAAAEFQRIRSAAAFMEDQSAVRVGITFDQALDLGIQIFRPFFRSCRLGAQIGERTVHHLVGSDFFFGIFVIPKLRLAGTDAVVKITDRFQIARGAVSTAEIPEEVRGIIERFAGIGRDPHERAGIVDQHLSGGVFQLNVHRVVTDGFDRKFGAERCLFRRFRRPDILFGKDRLSIQIFHDPIDSDFLIRRTSEVSGHGGRFVGIIDISDLPGFHHHTDRSPFQNCAIDFDRRRRFGWLAATVDIVVIPLEQTAHHFKVQEGIFLHKDHVLDLTDIQIKGDKEHTVTHAFYIGRQGSRFTPGQRDGLICDHLRRAAGVVGAVKTGQARGDIGCHLLFRIGRERAEDIRPVVLGDGNAADEAVRHGIEGGP